MKRYISLIAATIFCFIFISWGLVGHKVTGLIAETYLSQKAKLATNELLSGQSIADVASWADEVRSSTEYKSTAPWHYLNVVLGLSYAEFVNTVKTMPGENIHTALLKCMGDLQSQATTKDQKTVALKFLIHFIGDLHQPMHVSRSEDRGGNSIQVQFLGKGTNLHSLWDSGLLNRQALSDNQLVGKLEARGNAKFASYTQQSDLFQWLYESYKISTKLYGEVEKNNVLDESYYISHIDIVNQRLLLGGQRLATMLNFLFKDGLPQSAPSNTNIAIIKEGQTSIKVESKDVAKYINRVVITTGKIVSTRLIESNNMTLLNIGGENPNQDFTIMIKSDNRSKFGQPEVDLKGKTVTVEGMVIDYRGKAEIEVTDIKQIKVVH